MVDISPEEQDERLQRGDMPSFGARLAAKPMRVTPEAPMADTDPSRQVAAEAPPRLDASRPMAAPDVQVDPAAMPSGILRTQARPQDIPSPAGVSTTATTLPSLMQQRSESAKPIDPNATDASGKKMYRMGTGQRILASIANFGSGFAHTGDAPIYVGPGATNQRFARDTRMQQQRVGALDTDIKNQETLGEEQRKMFDSATKQAYEGELGEARQQTAAAAQARSAAMQDASDARGVAASAQKELADFKTRNQAPPEPKTEAEIAIAYQNALMKGDKASASKYKGAMDMLKQQKAAGKDTSAADLEKYLQVSEFKIRENGKVDNDKEAERKSRYAELDKNVQLKYNPTAMAAEKAKVDQGIETKYAQRYQSVNDQADQMLGLTKTGQRVNAQRGAGAKGKYQVGQTVMVDNKPYKVTGINPKTKKPIVAPQ
jgi:hypothetical protein